MTNSYYTPWLVSVNTYTNNRCKCIYLHLRIKRMMSTRCKIGLNVAKQASMVAFAMIKAEEIRVR